VLDILPGLCYYNNRKRKDTSQTRKEKTMRNFFRNLELDIVDVLGGFIILCMTSVVVVGIVTICTM